MYFSRLWFPSAAFAVALLARIGPWCRTDESCVLDFLFRSLPSNVFESIFYFFLLATPSLLLTIFIKPEKFSMWLKFSIGWLLFSVFLVVIFPASQNVWLPFYDISKETVAMYLGALYAVFSTVLILSNLITRKS